MATSVKIELSGGLEVLFGKVKEHKIILPVEVKKMRDLISYMAEKMLTERKELFVAGHSVRPGILVLVNDADWEIEGQLDYELQHGDVIAFISTLHGG
jgi:ubiquitin related modifier 1